MIEIQLWIIIALLAALWVQGTGGRGKVVAAWFWIGRKLTGRK
jgi:hypothetical protein